MLVKIRKTGNSLALTIPQEIANDLNLKEGDWLDVDKNGRAGMFSRVEIIPSLDPEIDKIAEKGIERFRHDLDKLAKSE